MAHQETAGQGIRVAIGQFNEMSDEKLRFAAQLGVKSVQMNTPSANTSMDVTQPPAAMVPVKMARPLRSVPASEMFPPGQMHNWLLKRTTSCAGTPTSGVFELLRR